MRRWIFAATVSFLLMAFTECNVGQFATSLQQCGTQSVVLPFAENPCDHALEALGLPAGWEWSDHFELLDPPEGIVIRGTLTARRIAALPGTAPLEEPVRYRYYRREDAPGSRWIPFEGTLLIRVLPYSVVATAVPERINVGDFSQLHAAVDGGTPPYTFTWIPPFWLSATDVSDPVASPPESVQYTVFVADSEGHLASDSVFVRVNIGAIATADPSVIEPGGLSQLTVEAEGGLRPYTFSWEPAAGLSATNIPNPIAAPGETTTYTVTVTDFNGDAASDSVTVEVAGIVPTEVTLTVAVEGTGAGKVTDVATGGEEIDCTTAGGDCEQSYPLNTPVALLAEPAPSSSFAGWTGCDDVDGHACLVTMSSDRTVTASFATEQDPPPPDLTLTVQVEGEGDGTVTALVGGETIDCSRAGGDCTADYPPGTVVTLEAIPDDRSAFAGWRSNGYDLAITRMEAMPNPAAVGEHLNFEIEVTNFGPDPAEGVVLVTLATGISPGTTNVTGAPPNVTLVSAPAECAQPDGQGNPLVCDLGEVLVGEAVVVSVIVAPNSATLPSGLGLSPLTNEAMVMGDGPDLNLSNNTASLQMHVLPQAGYDLAITRMEATPAPVLVEEILSYEIEVVNHGPETAEDLVLVTLATGISPLGQVVGPPPDVTLVTAPTECAQPDGPGNPLRCEMGDVAAGQTVTVILTVRPNAATLPLALGLPPLTNEAAVFTEGAVVGGDPDLDPSNNSASTVVQVLPKEGYDLAITRMEVTPDPAPMNQVLTYDIEVTNFGPDIAEDVVLFTLATGISPQGTGAPLDVTLVTAPAECAQPGGPGNLLRCELGDVGVGETVTVAVTVTPNSATLPLGLGLPPLTNEAAVFTQAAIAGGDQDLNPSNDTASTQVHVLPSDCSGTSPLTQVTMESHKTCTAVFDLLPSPDGFTLTVFNFGPEGVILGTVSSSPAGIDCSTGNIGVCEATFTSGTVVTLTAIDVEGTLFSWSDGDDCAHGAINRDVQIIMDSDKTCAAIFNPS